MDSKSAPFQDRLIYLYREYEKSNELEFILRVYFEFGNQYVGSTEPDFFRYSLP